MDTRENDQDEGEEASDVDLKVPLRWLGWAVLFVITIWGAFWFHLYDDPNRGTFGDLFGAANALFSGLAFAGVAYAILLQRAELRTQVRELKLSREELRKQREQLREQAIALRKQNFESTFFQLVRLQNDIVAAMNVKHPRDVKTEFVGRAAFKFFSNWFRDQFARAGSTNISMANEQYELLYKQYESYLGHYFRSLYNLVKLVDLSEVEDKELYTNLVRAQISSDEQVILFYNGLSRWAKKFKPLIEKYAFLKTIADDSLLHPSHRPFYQAGAYGKP